MIYGTKAGAEAFLGELCLLLTPQIPTGTAADWQGGREESTPQRSAWQPNWCAGRLTSTALLEDVLHSQVQLHRRLTSRLVSAVPRGMGVVKKHPSVYKHLSRAGLDPPKGSVPGIVPFPRCCQGIQLGAVCSYSSSVIHTSAEKGLNSITGLTTHLL